jgi:23S rRNA pseudoU1915 N3-methylase RlmH
MENEGEFSKLMSDESYMLALELSNFSASRKAGLESSQKKLDEEIEKAFNDSYVNFFLQIQGESVQSNRFCKVENIPKNLQEKLLEIRKKGGKPKLEQEMKMIKENQNSVRQCFQNLRKTLKD